ncbi:PEP/pyruvate-binding domain-containing protein [Aquisalimonas sp.]|uniref:PEP/pyruvate-binding domain-containing protein n=1 Tax=Aquisalimonas sp. TaxID=1872621 RepID=UPI0025C40FF6|nr:PEP/pyruvate-binding domain-containing protein [Aquisalimonas sp.]
MEQRARDWVSSGRVGLDGVLDGLRLGDNVVWRTSRLDDYRRYALAFAEAGYATGRRVFYLRYGGQAPVLPALTGVETVAVDPGGGFEPFTRQVHELINAHGHGAFYVCDPLSDLLDAWATDVMVGTFFRVVCPQLRDLATVAYFALDPARHSHTTVARIRRTTQVMIDVRTGCGGVHLQPVKVSGRRTPTLFLPHREDGEHFMPVTDSREVTRLQAEWEQEQRQQEQQRVLDAWDRLFLRVAACMDTDGYAEEAESVREQALAVLVGRDTRILALARRYLGLADLVSIRDRMVGSGRLGGKAVGMLLARAILLQEAPKTWGAALDPHDSWYVGADVYYAYVVHNGLWHRLMRQRHGLGDEAEARALHDALRDGEIPEEVRHQLERVLDHYGQYPILVRSSSLLEDGFGNAFAGKYASVFRINRGSPEERLAQLEDAIRVVYASTMHPDARSYRRERGLEDREEPMALLVQRVNGRFHGQLYCPDAAGVAVSRNLFPWSPDMDPAAGMVRLVAGLGTRAVDRVADDDVRLVALDQPERHPFAERDAMYGATQRALDVLDLGEEGVSTRPLADIAVQAPSLPLGLLAERDRESEQAARALGAEQAVWRLTFDPLLRRTPFAAMLRSLLQTLERAYAHPVEVEFTLHCDDEQALTCSVVQCRPLPSPAVPAMPAGGADAAARAVDDVFLALDRHFMGPAADIPIARIVRVNGQRYRQLDTEGQYAVARLVGAINREALVTPRGTLLIGPGRWGSSTPALGVPVGFADLQGVAALVELAHMDDDRIPELSYGSHFFQDLVEAGIVYAGVAAADDTVIYRPQWLEALPGARRCPLPGDVEVGAAAAATVEVFDVSDADVRLVVDVAARKLLCGRAAEQPPRGPAESVR